MPTELELGSPQVRNYQEDKSEDARVDDLHSLEEAVLIRTARYHQGLCHYHNQNIQHHVFAVGDLVLRRVQSSKDRHKDGNGSGSDRVESPCTQNRNPKSKPEPEPKTDSGGNPSPKPNPRIPETRTDTRNPNGYPKPADKYTHIHMYK
jgi:hypothetical protein